MTDALFSIKKTVTSSEAFEETIDEFIFTNIQKCLELREKYMILSCQRTCDNPKNAPDFVADPPKADPNTYILSIGGGSNGTLGNGNLLYTSLAASNSDVRLDSILEHSSLESSNISSDPSLFSHHTNSSTSFLKNDKFSSIPQPRSINIGPTYHLSHYDLDKCTFPPSIDVSIFNDCYFDGNVCIY